MSKQQDLSAYLFEEQPGSAELLSGELLRWMEASSRFTTFVETYRDKVRKKIRSSPEPESLLDLRSELETAYRLLCDRHFALIYEPYASAKKRSPDFSVSYRANLLFNIEVARLRVEEPEVGRMDFSRKEGRILRIFLYKLGQMQPGVPNLLAVHTHVDLVAALNLNRLMRAVKLKVEGKDASFYALSRYPNPAAFYKDFLHLSGIVLWASAPAALAPQVWPNKQSRPGLPEKVLRDITLALQAHPKEGI